MITKKNSQIVVFSILQRISHILLLNSLLLTEVGLYRGKIGLAITFAELFKYTSEDVFYDYMGNLLDDIFHKTHNEELDTSFQSGLSGIGWGIEYLIQNNLVEGESVRVCKEIDSKIMETDPMRICDYTLETGLEGLLHYIVYHLQGSIKQQTPLPFDETYLSDMYSVCKTARCKSKSITHISDKYISFIENKTLLNYEPQINKFATNTPELDYEALSTYPLGLNSGLAGYLIHLLENSKT